MKHKKELFIEEYSGRIVHSGQCKEEVCYWKIRGNTNNLRKLLKSKGLIR